MNEINNLYQAVIMDHSKNPRNFREPKKYDSKGSGYNQICGDKFDVFILKEKNVVKKITFTGHGCAISTAAASIMTEIAINREIHIIEKIFHEFKNMLTEENGSVETDSLKKLKIFKGVKKFPMRVKCALLPWYALMEAIKK